MADDFFARPVLNSPYGYPGAHWELDEDGQPTNRKISTRRPSRLIVAVPKSARDVSTGGRQSEMVLDSETGLSTADQEYNPTPIINEIRGYVEQWRNLPNPDQWLVTPETARLLQHWRSHEFQGVRPFFCQIEAVETAIWLTEVAPKRGASTLKFREHLRGANAEANPELMRMALKLATGAGKTTVMAMLIAWQVVNAERHAGAKLFSRGFLIVAPGITIKDRLRVLLPNDPESYYRSRELVPQDMMAAIERAKIVITNYHAFNLRERIEISKTGRALLKGHGPEIRTLETEGQMIQRVMPDLMGLKNVVVLNDEAHHCYRERDRPEEDDGEFAELKGDDKTDAKAQAKADNEAARLWISGLEAVNRLIGVRTVYDLSATPFFLRGSGYKEGTLFPWTVSDFSLMDAIECGIVKLPRIPISDNISTSDTPIYRKLWEHIRTDMPKKGRGAGGAVPDPAKLPLKLQTALQALYGHYEKTFALWREAKIDVPPVFIVVCNNTSASKLVHDYISGYFRSDPKGGKTFVPGAFDLFRNYDEKGERSARPFTLLIDSTQLESGDALDKDFREAASEEIDRYRRDLIARTGDPRAGDAISDQDLLREVMNTVGKKGRLGESIRCVVSVSMLTEGWDANTVTHILGVRAFGTQLLCEQVVGRALRRQSYDLNAEGKLDVEYADILGIPFDFTASSVVAPPNRPNATHRVHAVRPDRDALAIRFPRVQGYRVDLPEERIEAAFDKDSTLRLTPELVGPAKVRMQGIVGDGVTLTLEHLEKIRQPTIEYHLTKHLLFEKFRDPGEDPKLHLFGQLKRVVRQWLDAGHLACDGGTKPAMILYSQIADIACQRIMTGITVKLAGARGVRAIFDPYNPGGSTNHVNFTTSKSDLVRTRHDRCHVNFAVCDSGWEKKFCEVLEDHPKVLAWVKNQGLGFEVPYLMGAVPRRYLPDFIVRLDVGWPDPLNLVVEVKGYRGEDAKEKANTMRAFWIPAVNAAGRHGCWAFAEFTEGGNLDADFEKLVAGLSAAPVEA